MPTDTLPSYQVALEGFSAFERAAMASFFRLADRRLTNYVQATSLARCDLVVADTDLPEALAAVLEAGRIDDTVFVGANPPPGSLGGLPRPVDPVQIVRELDALVALRHPEVAPDSGPISLLPEEDILPDDLDLDLSLAAGPDAPMKRGRVRVPTTTRFSGGGRDVLVVDDSSIARKFLKQRLERLGYRVQQANDGESALEMLTHHAFTLVFVDMVLGPPNSVDGLQVCQFAKQRPAFGAHNTPAVVVVTGQTGSTHRVRASLAGCDGFLTKPLIEADFIDTLDKVDPLLRTEQPTGFG
ncbi:MAG: response regulator [Polaromonas sp.]|uniref:response regulator n=1 Tax=Polaromonas sp. TaxID=1869339 RepID=UPI002736B1BA|nr:response regulator [Polaromonas sp.]MDP3796753.1 response regulator [Polaromonas sp.]